MKSKPSQVKIHRIRFLNHIVLGPQVTPMIDMPNGKDGINIEFSDDPRFLEVFYQGQDYRELIPLTAVAKIDVK